MTDISNIPSTPHLAIITEVTVAIPGDERSRTAPGHGYPEHTETYIRYEAFDSKEAWLSKIKQLESDKWSYTKYKAMEVNPVKIEKIVSIKTS